MKRFLFGIILFYLLFAPLGVNTFSAQPGSKDDLEVPTPSSIIINQDEDLSRPIFLNIDNNKIVRQRNDTEGEGAVYQADVYQNVTITYGIVNGLNTTDLRFYADLGSGSNMSLSRAAVNGSLSFTFVNVEYRINYTLPYEIDGPVIANASLAIYTLELNVTAGYIPFYAATIAGLSEDDNGAPHNLLTIGQNWRTESFDEFYIQKEKVNITLSVENGTGLDIYGLEWKLTTESIFSSENFTTTFVSSNITSNLLFGEFDADTVFEWQSYAILNDTILNETRTINRIEHKFVEIGDGTPILEVLPISFNEDGSDALFNENKLYTRSGLVRFNFSASVSKGNITSFRIVTEGLNQSISPTVNASLLGETMNFNQTFTNEGKFNVSIFAQTDKELEINSTLTVIFDKINPLSSFLGESQTPFTIKSFEGQVFFEFSFSDENSEVRFAILDLGDGFQIEVTDMANYTYIYKDRNRFYNVKLTVIDWAGNIGISNTIVTLETPEFENTTAPRTELWGLIIVIILLVTSPLYYERLRNLLRR